MTETVSSTRTERSCESDPGEHRLISIALDPYRRQLFAGLHLQYFWISGFIRSVEKGRLGLVGVVDDDIIHPLGGIIDANFNHGYGCFIVCKGMSVSVGTRSRNCGCHRTVWLCWQYSTSSTVRNWLGSTIPILQRCMLSQIGGFPDTFVADCNLRLLGCQSDQLEGIKSAMNRSSPSNWDRYFLSRIPHPRTSPCSLLAYEQSRT